MLLKTILSRVERHGSFVYGQPKLEDDTESIVIPISPRVNSRPVCSGCGHRGGIYDTASKPRRFQFVPLWDLAVFFLYTMRRVNCFDCGVTTERVPWAEGRGQEPSGDIFRLVSGWLAGRSGLAGKKRLKPSGRPGIACFGLSRSRWPGVWSTETSTTSKPSASMKSFGIAVINT